MDQKAAELEVYKQNNPAPTEDEPEKVDFEIVSNLNGELKFKVPFDEGEYRLFCYAYDGKNKVGTANFPFYVE